MHFHLCQELHALGGCVVYEGHGLTIIPRKFCIRTHISIMVTLYHHHSSIGRVLAYCWVHKILWRESRLEGEIGLGELSSLLAIGIDEDIGHACNRRRG